MRDASIDEIAIFKTAVNELGLKVSNSNEDLGLWMIEVPRTGNVVSIAKDVLEDKNTFPFFDRIEHQFGYFQLLDLFGLHASILIPSAFIG